MPVYNDLDKRMKEFYECIPKTKLMRRCPVVIRIDGRSFHTFTRGFQKPFDDVLMETMQETMKYLCENVQGCVLGYTQSDEISLILIDYKKLTSSAFFDYEVQKVCSITASMATMAFNMNFQRIYSEKLSRMDNPQEKERLQNVYGKKCFTAMFDSRCFNIPKEEVANYLFWRQKDASRNSIQMVGQANFTHKELQRKSCSDIQDMLMLQRGINWNDLETCKKRGSCCFKEEYDADGTLRTRLVVDKEIPVFKEEGRNYIEKLIYVGES